MKNETIYLRADGGAEIGLGHLSRCLALANLLRPHFLCRFITRNNGLKIREYINKNCEEVEELPAFDNLLKEAHYIGGEILNESGIVILDGYDFNEAYQEVLKKSGCSLVVISDFIGEQKIADVVINHCGGIQPHEYHIGIQTKLCLGPEYAMLHERFSMAAGKQEVFQNSESLCICFGGSDVYNLTSKSLAAALNTDHLGVIHIIIGASNKAYDEIEQVLKIYEGRKQLYLHFNLDQSKMIETMSRCKYAITSASTVAYEACSIGIGLICGVYADNQKQMRSFLTQSGCAVGIDNIVESSVDELGALLLNLVDLVEDQVASQKSEFIDSRENLLKIFEKLRVERSLDLRKATKADLMTYFNWANDDEVRASGVRNEAIKLSEHESWFTGKLRSPCSFLYIYEQGGDQVGQVRFDLFDNYYEIGFSVAEEFRSRGIGEAMLRIGLLELDKEVKGTPKVIAKVRAGNLASTKVFSNNSFQYTAEEVHQGVSYSLYTKG